MKEVCPSNSSKNNPNAILTNNVKYIKKYNCLSTNEINYFFIKNNREDTSIQTESSALFEKEENFPIKTIEIKTRKYSSDLIRDKLFKYFNNILFYWLMKSKTNNSDVNIKKFQFEKNNKKCISEAMNKKLKDLFVSENEINKIDNGVLRQKLEFKYEYIYKLFISETRNSTESDDLLENFKFLDDFLKELELKKEKLDYILKVKNVALSYDIWKDKKIKI